MMVPPSVLTNALYDGQKSAGTLGLAFASAWLAQIASPACAAVTPLYAPPCFLRRKSTPTLLFGFTQNDTLAAWGFNYNEA